MTFQRHHLRRLILMRVQTMLVADKDLHRRDQSSHPHGHREHLARVGIRAVAQQVPRPNCADDQRRRQVGSDHRVGQAIRKARVENDRPPVRSGDETPVGRELIARRRVHPAVGAEDPECGDQCPDGDHQGRGEMQAWPDLAHAEQHHAEETRLEKEGRQHFISHQRAEDAARLVGEHRPIGAELVGHDDAATRHPSRR